jgi:hypothetical protein
VRIPKLEYTVQQDASVQYNIYKCLLALLWPCCVHLMPLIENKIIIKWKYSWTTNFYSSTFLSSGLI